MKGEHAATGAGLPSLYDIPAGHWLHLWTTMVKAIKACQADKSVA
ncbi:hypothetical protein ACWEO4_38855 [Streptomyces sp. NPDC004393]